MWGGGLTERGLWPESVHQQPPYTCPGNGLHMLHSLCQDTHNQWRYHKQSFLRTPKSSSEAEVTFCVLRTERSVQRNRLQVAWRPGWHLLHCLIISGIWHSPQLLEFHQVYIQHNHLLRVYRYTSCILVWTTSANFHWDFAAVHTIKKFNNILPDHS